MNDLLPYLAPGAIIVPIIILVFGRRRPVCMLPKAELAKGRRESQAHSEALTYLGSVIGEGAKHAPDPAWVRHAVARILELKEYPKRGNVGEWEEELARMLFTDDEPVDAWSELLGEYFEFARINLYCGFVKKHNIEAYELVRNLLLAQGIEAKPVEELAIGRL